MIRTTQMYRSSSVETKEISLGVEWEDPWLCWQRKILKLILLCKFLFWFIDAILTNIKSNTDVHVFFSGEKYKSLGKSLVFCETEHFKDRKNVKFIIDLFWGILILFLKEIIICT